MSPPCTSIRINNCPADHGTTERAQPQDIMWNKFATRQRLLWGVEPRQRSRVLCQPASCIDNAMQFWPSAEGHRQRRAGLSGNRHSGRLSKSRTVFSRIHRQKRLSVYVTDATAADKQVAYFTREFVNGGKAEFDYPHLHLPGQLAF